MPSPKTFENTEVEELIAMLRETENLEDQGDILQYLVDTQGLDYNTGDYDTPLKYFQLRLNRRKGQITFGIVLKLRHIPYSG